MQACAAAKFLQCFFALVGLALGGLLLLVLDSSEVLGPLGRLRHLLDLLQLFDDNKKLAAGLGREPTLNLPEQLL